MPELPDVVVYLECLQRRVVGPEPSCDNPGRMIGQREQVPELLLMSDGCSAQQELVLVLTILQNVRRLTKMSETDIWNVVNYLRSLRSGK